jgi:hypothetical protein
LCWKTAHDWFSYDPLLSRSFFLDSWINGVNCNQSWRYVSVCFCYINTYIIIITLLFS